MENKLPEYLRMRVNAAPDPARVFVFDGVRITVITPQLVRIEQGNFTDEATLTVLCRSFGACDVQKSQQDGVLTLDTGALVIRLEAGEPLETGLTIRRDANPAFTWHFGDKPLQNLGGTTSTLDVVNGACALDDGILSIDGFAVIDDSATPLMTADGWFEPRGACLDVYFFGYGHEYEACIKDYYRLTGVPSMLPAYALGNWWSRYHKYTAEEYLALMDRFEEKDVPLSVAIVDMDWHITDGEGRPYHSDYFNDGWTGYTWNEKYFPDYRAFLRAIHERGLRTSLNLHPASGVRSHEAQYGEMARRMGIDPASGEPVRFNCLDPEFLKAYFEVLHFPYEEDGVDFWWMDWQQGSDYDKVAGKDRAGRGLEAISPLWMLNHMHSMAARRTGKRSLIFSRYSGYGSQRYPIGFSGDTFITWDTLNFQPYFTATASNIGYGWWSHDLGGHLSGVRDDELMARWVQFGVFSPIFRLHCSNSVFTGREPWRYNKRAEWIMEDFMRLRHRLFPYLYTMCLRNCEELIPLMRPMYHTHPDCPQAYQVKNEYWFGSEMIAAPITSKGDASELAHTTVWLPEGVWTDAFTGYVYRGGQTIEVYRPMERMPVFMKAGAIVPMQVHEAKSRKLGCSANMEIYVAPGASNRFVLAEDDGESLDDTQRAFTEMTLDWQAKEAAFTVAPAKGVLSLIPQRRSWKVHLRGFARGCTFSVGGQAVTSRYDEETCTHTVLLEDVPAEEGFTLCAVHETALTHDDSDCYDRVMDMITRAQNTLREKNDMRERLELALKEAEKGKRLPKYLFGMDTQPSLAGALYELAMQLPADE